MTDAGARSASASTVGRPGGPSDRPGSRRSTQSRGQTTVDYLIGLMIFLVAIVFVFGFVPSIFAPFTVDSGGTTVLADRSADRLAGDLLVASPEQPAVLNRTCTVGFFDADGNAPTGCRYDDATDGKNLSAALGLGPTSSANVTVRRDGSVATLGGTPLAVGDPPEGNADIVISRRVVLIDDTQYQLFLRVW